MQRLRLMPFPLKVIAALLLCCTLVAAGIWARHSRLAGIPELKQDTGTRSGAVSLTDIEKPESETGVTVEPQDETTDAASRPETGMNLIRVPRLSGLGTLRISNGTGRDATVKVVNVSTGKLLRWVYIRSSYETTLRGISPCSCIVRFAIGSDWDRRSLRFHNHRSYSQFDDSLDFTETKIANRIQYATFEITLQPVVGGTAKTQEISEVQFEQGVP